MSDELSAFDVIRTPTQSTPVDRMRDVLLSERAVIEAAVAWHDYCLPTESDPKPIQDLFSAISVMRRAIKRWGK